MYIYFSGLNVPPPGWGRQGSLRCWAGGTCSCGVEMGFPWQKVDGYRSKSSLGTFSSLEVSSLVADWCLGWRWPTQSPLACCPTTPPRSPGPRSWLPWTARSRRPSWGGPSCRRPCSPGCRPCTWFCKSCSFPLSLSSAETLHPPRAGRQWLPASAPNLSCTSCRCWRLRSCQLCMSPGTYMPCLHYRTGLGWECLWHTVSM